MATDPDFGVITSQAELRAIYPEPVDLIKRKVMSSLDDHCVHFIAHSPLAFLSTSSADGACDVTPRGDLAGFVSVIDRKRIALPDRPGNNRIDSLRNILENPHVGLLIVVPGVIDALRINGSACIATNKTFLATMRAEGRAPRSAILIDVEEAFFHCGKAFRRSLAWDASTYLPPGTLPTLAQMLADQTGADAVETGLLAQSGKEPLY